MCDHENHTHTLARVVNRFIRHRSLVAGRLRYSMVLLGPVSENPDSEELMSDYIRKRDHGLADQFFLQQVKDFTQLLSSVTGCENMTVGDVQMFCRYRFL